MIADVRKKYNEQFTVQKYKEYIEDLSNVFPGNLEFRIAETPVFVPLHFLEKAQATCQYIIDTVLTPDYLQKSERAIPPHLRVPAQDDLPHFIAFDFGVCLSENGELEPQLIELQGFPSMFAWQVIMPEVHSRHLWQPDHFAPYLSNMNKQEYLSLFKKIVVGDTDPREVILLELFPQQQKTRVDFLATEQLLGIKTVCLTDIIQKGKDLFYDNNGMLTPVKRIYNRVIFDELLQQEPAIKEKGRLFQQELNVTWVPHPNWFYRISKFTMPFLVHPFVPETHFLNDIPLPEDLENYVVKPLFSFAGQGVIIDVTKEAVDHIRDPENWIIQRKVAYASAIQTPDDPAKAEIRLFYFLDPDTKKLKAANNLSRLSKGKMIGVRYNKDKDWVGGSFCLFEQPAAHNNNY